MRQSISTLPVILFLMKFCVAQTFWVECDVDVVLEVLSGWINISFHQRAAQGAGLPAQEAGQPAQGAEPPAQGAGLPEPDQGVGPPATSIPQLDGVDDPEPTERDRARDLQTEQLDGGADPETEEEQLLYMKNFEAFMDGFEERNSYLKTHEYNGNNLNELEYLIFYVIQKWDPDQGTST